MSLADPQPKLSGSQDPQACFQAKVFSAKCHAWWIQCLILFHNVTKSLTESTTTQAPNSFPSLWFIV